MVQAIALPCVFLTGAPGCGKSALAKFLEQDCGFFLIDFPSDGLPHWQEIDQLLRVERRRAEATNAVESMPIVVCALPSRLIFERFQNAVSRTVTPPTPVVPVVYQLTKVNLPRR